MKIKPKTLEKYSRFLALTREDEPRPIDKIPYSENGVSGVEAFHVLESTGKIVPTREPILLERYMQGKIWHGVTVKTVAESFAIDRLAFSLEIKRDYPKWVADEIFAQAEKIAQKRLGFVPTFIRNRRDFSEPIEDTLGALPTR